MNFLATMCQFFVVIGRAVNNGQIRIINQNVVVCFKHITKQPEQSQPVQILLLLQGI